MHSIKELKNIKGKTILVRVDFNVPMKGNSVEDNFRIKKALPTINFLIKKGAKIILITHLGKGEESLKPVAKVLNKYINVRFIPEVIGVKVTKAVSEMKIGDVILLENLRMNKGEQKPDESFAKSLAKLADIYVNEAFPVSHRGDASIVLVPKLLPHYAGFQWTDEVKNLSMAFKKPKHPFLFILGGAKFETKLPIIKRYIKTADHLFIGGAMLNDFLKAKGFEVGVSLVSDKNFGVKEMSRNKKLIIPENVLVKTFDNKYVQKHANEVSKNDNIIDLGDKAVKMIEPYIKSAKLILWNGPLGKYEDGGAGTTKKILKLIAKSKAISIIGGGDTVEIISEMKMEKNFSFVSTGGGATLDFLANGTLPGIKALG